MALFCHTDWGSYDRMSGWGGVEVGGTDVQSVDWRRPALKGMVIITTWRKNEMTYYCHQDWEHHDKIITITMKYTATKGNSLETQGPGSPVAL